MTDTALHLLFRDRRRWQGTLHELCEIRPDGSDGDVIAMTQRTLAGLRSQFVFHADEKGTRPVFAVTSDHVWDTFGTHAITDASGVLLGSFRKDIKASIGRSRWHLETADGITAVGRERSRVWALVRRFSSDPAFRFDFVTDDGHIVLSSVRRWTWRRQHDLTVPLLPDGRQLDWRVAVAVGVGVGIMQRE